jgi:predicted DNA-binding protein (MmcQ/YjbR family)
MRGELMLGALVATRHRIADALARHALAMPEAWEDHPWEGDRVAKVRKKIFAFLPSDDAGSVGVKLPRSAAYALTLACATQMAYGLGKHGWVTVALADASCPDPALLLDWIDESYATVAPKTLVARRRIEPQD